MLLLFFIFGQLMQGFLSKYDAGCFVAMLPGVIGQDGIRCHCAHEQENQVIPFKGLIKVPRSRIFASKLRRLRAVLSLFIDDWCT